MVVLQLIKMSNPGGVPYCIANIFYSVYFAIQRHSRISLGKVKDEGLKEQ